MTATGLASRNFEQFRGAGRRKGAMVGFLDASSRPDLLAGSCEHREVRPRQLHNGVGRAVHTRLVRKQIAINVIRSLWSYLNHVDGFTEAAFLIADRDLPAHVWWAECCCGHKRSALQSLAIRLLHIRRRRRPPKETGLISGSFTAGFGAG